MDLYFDNNNEHIFVNGKWFNEPIGTAFIDFVSADFYNKESFSVLADKSFFRSLLTSKMNLTEEEKKLFADYHVATDCILNIDYEYYKNIDIVNRYFLYQSQLNPSIVNKCIKKKYIAIPFSNVTPINNSNNGGNQFLNARDTISEDFVSRLLEVYTIDTLDEALYISLLKMVSNRITVRRCSCCGKFFIPAGRSDTEYCNRLAPNSTKTCSEIGAVKKYHKKTNEDPIKREYQKIYKKMHSRIKSKKITTDQFVTWADKARKIRDMAEEENWDLQKFIGEINKLEV